MILTPRNTRIAKPHIPLAAPTPGSWILEGGGGGGATVVPVLIIGFGINNGDVGFNVGPMLPAPRSGTLTRLIAVIKVSDTTACWFNIERNGVQIFGSDIVLPAGAPAGAKVVTTGFSVTVAKDDIFTIDIDQGTANWQFVAQMEGT